LWRYGQGEQSLGTCFRRYDEQKIRFRPSPDDEKGTSTAPGTRRKP
jgi:hypothetical protein